MHVVWCGVVYVYVYMITWCISILYSDKVSTMLHVCVYMYVSTCYVFSIFVYDCKVHKHMLYFGTKLYAY